MNLSQRLLARSAGFALVLACAAVLPAWAAGDHGAHGAHGAQGKPNTQATASTDMAEAEVRRVDKEGGKLTLKHGEIKNLDMPPMTMVFVVKDKAMLDAVKAGDRIRFKAINDAGKYTVTELQVVRQP